MWKADQAGAMPTFWPPRPHPFWSVALDPVRRYLLHRYLRVAELHVAGLEAVSQRLGPHDGVLIAPNHSHDSDPHVLLEIGRRVRKQFYFMAAWQLFPQYRGLAGFCMQRLGAFSVDREGCDRRAIKQAVELLTTGRHLVVFPEGDVYHLNERLTPLLEGVAFMALSAQRDLEKNRPESRVWVVPCAIRYRFLEDVTPRLEAVLAGMERRFLVAPVAGAALAQRIARLGEMLLTLKEKEKLGKARDAEGDLPARLHHLIDTLLTNLERQWLEKPSASEAVPLRVKAVRRAALAACADDKADAQTRAKAREALDDVHLALQLFSYPGNYLAAEPTPERICETLCQFEEDMNGKPLRPPGRRRADVVFGEPIDLKAKLGAGRPRTLAGDVTDELEERIGQLMCRDQATGAPSPVG